MRAGQSRSIQQPKWRPIAARAARGITTSRFSKLVEQDFAICRDLCVMPFCEHGIRTRGFSGFVSLIRPRGAQRAEAPRADHRRPGAEDAAGAPPPPGHTHPHVNTGAFTCVNAYICSRERAYIGTNIRARTRVRACVHTHAQEKALLRLLFSPACKNR